MFCLLKDILKALDGFKNKQKSEWSNIFWYVKVSILWKCMQYTIQWDRTQMLKQFTSDIINDTKNALFFLSWALTHHSFTFNLQFLYELKHNVSLSKTVCGIFQLQFRFVFIYPFRITRFLFIEYLWFFNILLTMSHKLRQCLFCYQHLSRFWENFGGTGILMALKSNTSSIVGWKCSRLIYLKIC